VSHRQGGAAPAI